MTTTPEQLKAWTKIKSHLMHTTQLIKKSIDGAPPNVQDEGRMIIEDIEDNIDVIEQLFLI